MFQVNNFRQIALGDVAHSDPWKLVASSFCCSLFILTNLYYWGIDIRIPYSNSAIKYRSLKCKQALS